jgi:hypothetical protein
MVDVILCLMGAVDVMLVRVLLGDVGRHYSLVLTLTFSFALPSFLLTSLSAIGKSQNNLAEAGSSCKDAREGGAVPVDF